MTAVGGRPEFLARISWHVFEVLSLIISYIDFLLIKERKYRDRKKYIKLLFQTETEQAHR